MAFRLAKRDTEGVPRWVAALLGAWAASIWAAVVYYVVWLMAAFEEDAEGPQSQRNWIIAFGVVVAAAAIAGGAVGYAASRASRARASA